MDEIRNDPKARIQSKAANAVMIIMVMTMLTKVLGFVREMAIASRFGAGMESDAYKIALMVPAILYASIESILVTTFIPVFLGTEKDKRQSLMNNLITGVVLVGTALMILGMIFAPTIIALTAPGFPKQASDMAISLIRVMFPIVIFMGLSSLSAAYLQAHHHFLAPAVMAIPNNLLTIATLFLLGFTGVYGLAVATVIGVLLQVVLQVPYMKKYGFSYKLEFNLKDPGLRRIGQLAVPVLLGTMVSQVNSLVDKILASTLLSGNLSALDYANKINGMVLAIFATSVVVVSYPMLSRLSAEGKFREFSQFFRKSLQQVFFITFPMMIGLMLLNLPVIRLLFERGAFTREDSHLTAVALLFYSIGIPAAGLREVLNKAFYSLQDTRTPMVNGVVAVLINIVLNLILIRYLAIAGVALATALSAIISTMMLFMHLRNKMGNYFNHSARVSFLRTIVASAGMGGTVYFLEHQIFRAGADPSLWMVSGKLTLEVLAGISVFVLVAWIVRSDELTSVFNTIAAKLWKRRREMKA